MNNTFDEWKAKGYHVIKGQKATGRNSKGVATFMSSQVKENYGEQEQWEEETEAETDFYMIGAYIQDMGDRD